MSMRIIYCVQLYVLRGGLLSISFADFFEIKRKLWI